MQILEITALQLFAHGVGDYWFQSDWMANEKTKENFMAKKIRFSLVLGVNGRNSIVRAVFDKDCKCKSDCSGSPECRKIWSDFIATHYKD